MYMLLVPLNLVLTALAILLAPVLPLFSTNEMGWVNNAEKESFGPRLPKWLGWFQTWDNSLSGDATFQTMFPPNQWWSQVHWLWRNPLPTFSLRTLSGVYWTSWQGDKTIKDNDNAKEGWCLVHANGLFQLVYVKRIFSSSRCIYINLGWNIRALVDDNVQPKPDPYIATLVFSPRISGFR